MQYSAGAERNLLLEELSRWKQIYNVSAILDL